MEKKNEKKRNEQRYLYGYKKIVLRNLKFETQNLRRDTTVLVLVEDKKGKT